MASISGLFFISPKPDTRQILEKSYQKCQSIQNGYYEMTYYSRNVINEGTFTCNYKCYFKKMPADTIYGAEYHYHYSDERNYSVNVLYNGNELIRYRLKDSTGTTQSVAIFGSNISKSRIRQTFP